MSRDEPDKRGRGRPPGKDYPVAIHVRLTDEQAARVDAYRAGAGISRAEAIRRAIDRLTIEE